ncbi:MAG: selenocysteine-specific translation elongation factor [Steroidobacteraceae bacterium]
MIVATAGHVDHGKTTLIRALTGTDTTHLPEERKRGMTIDLGFAGLALSGGNFIGFVDVPGHERFMRNMLAGITGVDFALLVVAADDGIMPQSREHLEILDLLNVTEGAVALTKTDRVDGTRLAAVGASLAEMIAPTTLADAPIFPVSVRDNLGISALCAHLVSRATQVSRHRHGALFRLPIDRCFVAEGAGLVVTGTIASGRVAVGDRLRLMPLDKPIRVRGLHAHHTAVQSLGAGERCALNVVASELDRSQLGRGNWIVASEIAVASQHLDVRLRLAAGAVLQDGACIQFCHGAAGIHGRVVPLRRDADPRYVQIVLDEPVHALTKDAFILRDAHGSKTLAGGIVLDPFPPIRGRRRSERIAMLTALEQPDVRSALAALLPLAPEGVELERFTQAWNIRPDEAEALWVSVGLTRFEARGYDAVLWRQLREAMVAEVARFHLAHPDSFGPLASHLLRTDTHAGRRQLQRAVLNSLIDDKELIREGAQLRRPTHEIELSSAEKALWRRIAPLIGPKRRPMSMHDIATTQKLELKIVKRVLERAARAGYVVRIAPGRFMHKSALLDLAVRAEALATNSNAKLFSAASFRDQSDLGRGISIELLEYFDRIGFTQRIGDQRRVLKSAAAVFAGERFEKQPVAS